jgi:hypothetical protein
LWSAEWPAAAQCQVHAHSQFSGLSRYKAQRVQVFVGEKREVSDPFRLIIKSEGINRLHFKPADAAFLHQAHLAFELRFGNCWSKPPPAHHDTRVVRRLLKGLLELVDILSLSSSEA